MLVFVGEGSAGAPRFATWNQAPTWPRCSSGTISGSHPPSELPNSAMAAQPVVTIAVNRTRCAVANTEPTMQIAATTAHKIDQARRVNPRSSEGASRKIQNVGEKAIAEIVAITGSATPCRVSSSGIEVFRKP